MDPSLITSSSAAELSAKKIFGAFPRRAEKRFGQNFLFDEKINRKIVSSAGDLSGKVVAEVGPGPGGLTLEILKHDIKKLYIVEVDPHWSRVWKNLGASFFEKSEVIECDALQCNFKDLAPDVIISNLPYNISTTLLVKWLKELDFCEKLILMFQKEVAERLYAVPATKSYGRLSVLAQSRSRVEKVFDLEPGSFFPAPKVKSAVLKFTLHSERPCDFCLFSDLLAAVFAHRRKVAVKSLSDFFPDPERVLVELGYNKNTRAEEISVKDYIELMRKKNYT
ncbi:MAG: 16S rRNA (adenine(1518)-N(6)/adenine(1519)-N(6))-dimethyltransferase RsmA [Holosporaceae bacterium]|jgi:16S rRNA (adenine1518-N6/adenine1519-N6)-dimethyltransferase|nr:16S rRNA (adenine(1518)-N(6)/adenine(1519)-N(6))-dimethyltransferase RsmA [Holosporaceae bacterium]